MRPADTERLSTVDRVRSVDNKRVLACRNEGSVLSSPSLGCLACAASDSALQARAPVARPTRALRLAVVQSAVSLTDDSLSRLEGYGVLPFVFGPENLLRQLNLSAEAFDIIAYPIAGQWQRALEFSREIRRIRDRQGAPPYPKTLIISFAEQFPATIEWFRRTRGTHYLRFNSEDQLVQILRSMHQEIRESLRAAYRLHLRIVHAGNQSGIGCLRGESLDAIYASFLPGQEDEVEESNSLLRFLNLLGMHRWRSRTAAQLVQLMCRNAFYSSEGPDANMIGRSSVKMYVHRCETALLRIWRKQIRDIAPPPLIRRDSRDGREIAYRLLATCEIDHL